MIENIKTYELELTGRVQGVGFRYFVESIAGRFGITGFVKNTFDRKVEIVCQGEEKDLKKFVDEVKKGPSFSVVTDVKIEEIKDSKKYNIFEIKF